MLHLDGILKNGGCDAIMGQFGPCFGVELTDDEAPCRYHRCLHSSMITGGCDVGRVISIDRYIDFDHVRQFELEQLNNKQINSAKT